MAAGYRGAMRPVSFGHAAALASAWLLVGCAGGTTPTPAQTTAPTPPTTTVTTDPAPKLPLAGDLTGGTPLRLGSVGHWAIADGSAFVATAEGTVVALELATGSTTWQAGFSLGEPWDAPSDPRPQRREVHGDRRADGGC